MHNKEILLITLQFGLQSSTQKDKQQQKTQRQRFQVINSITAINKGLNMLLMSSWLVLNNLVKGSMAKLINFQTLLKDLVTDCPLSGQSINSNFASPFVHITIQFRPWLRSVKSKQLVLICCNDFYDWQNVHVITLWCRFWTIFMIHTVVATKSVHHYP